ncbi:Ig-like domain-containing protein [Myxococcaceae bacterium GXIMD 01537]
MSPSRAIPLLAACAALLLSACTPEPGPQNPDAGSPPDAGDTTAPILSSTTPAEGATGVSTSAALVLEFSEPMRLDRGTVLLSPGDVTLRASREDWDASQHRLTLALPGPLPSSTRVTATVTMDFMDTSGNRLIATAFHFTTRDETAPTVTAATPAEGASRVPLTTSTVSLTFSEPMDSGAGTLVPSEGLTLGAPTWSGNTLTVPLSGLDTARDYTLRLEGFRDVAGNVLDGRAYLGDGSLDFTTGRDETAPMVTEATPAEGSTGLYPTRARTVRLTFSERMDTTQGGAELVEGNTRVALTPTWLDNGLAASFDLTGRLRPAAAFRLVLSGFKDLAGNALDGTPTLGDGALDFGTVEDTQPPHVSAATPSEGAQDVYPGELYLRTDVTPSGTYFRSLFTFTFSEPMDRSNTRHTLVDRAEPSRPSPPSTAAFSEDGLTLTLTLHQPPAGGAPLADEREYALDLTALEDLAGNRLDAAHALLGDGRLDFKTLAHDDALNHACAHTLFDTPEAVTAASSLGTFPPPPMTDRGHGRYRVTLPETATPGEHQGYTELVSDPDYRERITLYLSHSVSVRALNRDSGTDVPVTLKATPRACAGVTHRADFEAAPGDVSHLLHFGPLDAPHFDFVLERHALD